MWIGKLVGLQAESVFAGKKYKTQPKDERD
jgi:hypothetical protein